MSNEDIEKATIQNTIATKELITIANQTTKDVDKLVKHMDKILPIHTEMANIKKMLYSSIGAALLYGAWCTLYIVDNHEKISNHSIVYSNRVKHIDSEIKIVKEKVNNNKNQITYLKGSKQNKRDKS